MTTTTAKIALEEFAANRDPRFHKLHELHDGEIVIVPPTRVAHQQLQKHLQRLLEAHVAADHEVYVEFYYTLASDARRADVAAILKTRVGEQRKGIFRGAPNLVIEILSPSNEYLDVDHIRDACLKDAALQFWVINPDLQTVTVFERGNKVKIYDLKDTGAFGWLRRESDSSRFRDLPRGNSVEPKTPQAYARATSNTDNTAHGEAPSYSATAAITACLASSNGISTRMSRTTKSLQSIRSRTVSDSSGSSLSQSSPI